MQLFDLPAPLPEATHPAYPLPPDVAGEQALHRDNVQGEAEGPDLHRLAAQPARVDRNPALQRARATRSAGCRADCVERGRQSQKWWAFHA